MSAFHTLVLLHVFCEWPHITVILGLGELHTENSGTLKQRHIGQQATAAACSQTGDVKSSGDRRTAIG